MAFLKYDLAGNALVNAGWTAPNQSYVPGGMGPGFLGERLDIRGTKRSGTVGSDQLALWEYSFGRGALQSAQTGH